MSNEPPTWAVEIKEFLMEVGINRSVPDWMASKAQRLVDAFSAIAAALAIPDNHVRLPSGEVVRVLGTLPMTADGCVCGVGGTIYIDSIIQKQVVACELADGRSGWLTSPVCYSTREAAESARAGGGA